jgi:hypothetical protein
MQLLFDGRMLAGIYMTIAFSCKNQSENKALRARFQRGALRASLRFVGADFILIFIL